MNMSVVFTFDNGWIISHDKFIREVYENVHGIPGGKLKFDSSLFEINTPFTRTSGKKEIDLRIDKCAVVSSRKRGKEKYIKRSGICDDIALVEQRIATAIEESRKQGYLAYIPTENERKLNNLSARNKAHSLYVDCISTLRLHGANTTSEGLVTEVDNECYVIPAECSFFCYDVKDIDKMLDLLLPSYDLLLLDPPWWNKYIRRKKAKCTHTGYQMMYDNDLTKIPVATLTVPGALIAVWCTNSDSHLNYLQNEIFPAWDVEFIGKWFWLKVTRSGEPICQFSEPPGKQPFEQIVFGYRKSVEKKQHLPEPNKIIISVPSAIHSHKPPLSELLAPYLPATPRCLELFARYLLPGWTSWGCEVLKLQHRSLYIENDFKS